ncbi:cysteine synthase family protein [Thalassospira sp. MA62]|nr:cysteine synthase family protein [Thalassospira sp. MA62]
MIVNKLSETIGDTPLLRIPLRQGNVELFIKLETFNPCGSMKDRMALKMLQGLEANNHFTSGSCIVESSSGNTATALSMLCAERGYEFVALMDNHAAPEKIRAVQALGGNVNLVESSDGQLATAVRDQVAEEMATHSEKCYWTAQHDNPDNAAGYDELANELICDLGPDIDYFISAIGTGGSLCGTARALRRQIPNLKTVGVEPKGSIIFGSPAHDYHQSGTGTPFGASVGLVIDYDVINEGRKVGDEEAFATCRVLAKRLGLLVGGSTGGAIYEALQEAQRCADGTRIVTLACDAGSKYTDSIFNNDWLKRHGFDLTEREKEVQGFLNS